MNNIKHLKNTLHRNGEHLYNVTNISSSLNVFSHTHNVFLHINPSFPNNSMNRTYLIFLILTEIKDGLVGLKGPFAQLPSQISRFHQLATISLERNCYKVEIKSLDFVCIFSWPFWNVFFRLRVVSGTTETSTLTKSSDEQRRSVPNRVVLSKKTAKSQICQLKTWLNNVQTCVCSTGTKCGPWRVTVWSGLRFEICTFNKGIFESSCAGSRNGATYAVHRSIWWG